MIYRLTVEEILSALDDSATTLQNANTEYAKGIHDYSVHLAERIRPPTNERVGPLSEREPAFQAPSRAVNEPSKSGDWDACGR